MTSTWMQIPFILLYCACKLPSLSLWDETRLVKKTSRQWLRICQNFMKTSLGTTTSQPCGCRHHFTLEMKDATWDGQSTHFLVIFPIAASFEVLSVRRSYLLSRLRDLHLPQLQRAGCSYVLSLSASPQASASLPQKDLCCLSEVESRKLNLLTSLCAFWLTAPKYKNLDLSIFVFKDHTQVFIWRFSGILKWGTSYIKMSAMEPSHSEVERERNKMNRGVPGIQEILTSHYLDYPTYNFPIFGIIDFWRYWLKLLHAPLTSI